MSCFLVKTGRCLVSSPLWMTRSQPKTQLLRSVTTTTTSVSFHQNTVQQQTNNFTNQQQHHHQQHQQHVQLQKASFHSSLSRQQEQNTNASKHYPTVTFSSPKLTELFDRIVYLDLVEIHLLTEILNQKMGITLTDADRANMAAGGGGGGAGGGGAAAEEAPKEEKTAFDLKLTGFDAKAKIKVIKEVRAMTGLGLKEAKEMVEGAPKVLKKELKKEEAEELKAKLEAVGATVELA